MNFYDFMVRNQQGSEVSLAMYQEKRRLRYCFKRRF